MGCDWKLTAKVIAILDIITCCIWALIWFLAICGVTVQFNDHYLPRGSYAWGQLITWIVLLVIAILLLLATLDKFDKKVCLIICIVWIVVNVLWSFWGCYAAFVYYNGFDGFGFIQLLLRVLFIALVIPFTIECAK